MVKRMKKRLIPALSKAGKPGLAARIDVDSDRHGKSSAEGVAVLKKKWGLGSRPNGTVTKEVWKRLGFHVHDEDANEGRVLRGIKYERGVVEVDGNWVAAPLAKILLNARRKGDWDGVVTSGWRPDSYQAMLFEAAVKKYGSEAAARKWVAPPGRSNHRHKDERAAADITLAYQAVNSGAGLYLPMSWEDWHVQIRSAHQAATAAPDGLACC